MLIPFQSHLYTVARRLSLKHSPITWFLHAKWKWSRSVCPTLWDPMGCSPPGSSVHGNLQARILEWVAISFSRGSSQPRDGTQVSRIAGRCFTLWATRETSSTQTAHYPLRLAPRPYDALPGWKDLAFPWPCWPDLVMLPPTDSLPGTLGSILSMEDQTLLSALNCYLLSGTAAHGSNYVRCAPPTSPERLIPPSLVDLSAIMALQHTPWNP